MIRPTRPLALIVIALCCGITAPALAAEPVVLFDQGHGQRFAIEETGELQLSQLAEVFRSVGFRVRSTAAPLTAEALAGAAVVVTSGLFQPYTAEELQALLGFVENGGGLSVMLHIAPTYANLLQALGVLVSQGVLNEGEGVLDENPLNYRVASFSKHPLTAGLEQFRLYGGWAVMDNGRDEGVKTVAFTSRSSWIDADRDRQRGPQEVRHSYGVVVAGERGKGRFAVFGDDAIFQNGFLDADNRKLAANLAAWLLPARGT
jgi:hypothetical protein